MESVCPQHFATQSPPPLSTNNILRNAPLDANCRLFNFVFSCFIVWRNHWQCINDSTLQFCYIIPSARHHEMWWNGVWVRVCVRAYVTCGKTVCALANDTLRTKFTYLTRQIHILNCSVTSAVHTIGKQIDLIKIETSIQDWLSLIITDHLEEN